MNRFEKLRDMESFTDDMLNRIISFQEKEHAAWRADLPFDQRIRGLPLHYLVFSCNDRDPAKFGPTVSPYYPLRREMQRIKDYAVQTADHPVVCEVYAGNGFLGSLLAREGVHVIGVSRHGGKPNQITSFYDAQCYSFAGDVETFEVAFCAWPLPNPTTESVLQKRPKLIVCVFTEHQDENGARQTGSPEQVGALAPDYRLIDEWTVVRPKDLFHTVWPDLTPSPEEIRHTRVYARHDCAFSVPAWREGGVYDWEKELAMALLAIEAQEMLRSRGYRL